MFKDLYAEAHVLGVETTNLKARLCAIEVRQKEIEQLTKIGFADELREDDILVAHRAKLRVEGEVLSFCQYAPEWVLREHVQAQKDIVADAIESIAAVGRAARALCLGSNGRDCVFRVQVGFPPYSPPLYETEREACIRVLRAMLAGTLTTKQFNLMGKQMRVA